MRISLRLLIVILIILLRMHELFILVKQLMLNIRIFCSKVKALTYEIPLIN